MWRLCRSCVHLRILRGCYIKALQYGGPSCHTGEGTAPPFVLGHEKSLSSAVHPGAAHWKEGNAIEVILSAFSHCHSNDFGSLWWGMCCIYQYPENVNWLWQYNIFWMYDFPIEILYSFHWLSLVIRVFWKVIGVFHKAIQIAVEPVGDISAYNVQLLSGPITWLMFSSFTVSYQDTCIPLSYRLVESKGLVMLPNLCSVAAH